MKANKQLINRLVQQAIQNLLPMQIAVGVKPHQRVRNPVALWEIVSSHLVLPYSIKDGINKQLIAGQLDKLGYHYTDSYLSSTITFLLQQELIRSAPGPKIAGKKGPAPRIYAIN